MNLTTKWVLTIMHMLYFIRSNCLNLVYHINTHFKVYHTNIKVNHVFTGLVLVCWRKHLYRLITIQFDYTEARLFRTPLYQTWLNQIVPVCSLHLSVYLWYYYTACLYWTKLYRTRLYRIICYSITPLCWLYASNC